MSIKTASQAHIVSRVGVTSEEVLWSGQSTGGGRISWQDERIGDLGLSHFALCVCTSFWTESSRQAEEPGTNAQCNILLYMDTCKILSYTFAFQFSHLTGIIISLKTSFKIHYTNYRLWKILKQIKNILMKQCLFYLLVTAWFRF